MKLPRKAVELWARAGDEYAAACAVEPAIGEAVARAQHVTGTEREGLVTVAAGMLAPLAPSLPVEAWHSILLAIVAGEPVRTSHVPGVPERTVWVIRDDADAVALASYIDAGQLWIRADHVPPADWPAVYAVARRALAIDLEREPDAGGRPKGSGRLLSWGELIEAVRSCEHDERPSAEHIALDMDWGERTVERYASGGPAGDGIGGGWDAVLVAADRQ